MVKLDNLRLKIHFSKKKHELPVVGRFGRFAGCSETELGRCPRFLFELMKTRFSAWAELKLWFDLCFSY